MIKSINSLYQSGLWTKSYKRNKPSKTKKIVNENDKYNNNINIKVEKKEMKTKTQNKIKITSSEKFHESEIQSETQINNCENSKFEDRPLPALNKKSNQIIEEFPEEKVSSKPHVSPHKEFLKRKTKYDPKKAIEQSKNKVNHPTKIKRPIIEEIKKNLDLKDQDNITDKKDDISKEKHNIEVDNLNHEEKNNQNSNKINENASAKGKEGIESAQEKTPSKSSPKPYLKRKTQQVEGKKVDWGKVASRIDCWNKRSKDVSEKFEIEPKIIKPQSRLENTKVRQERMYSNPKTQKNNEMPMQGFEQEESPSISNSTLNHNENTDRIQHLNIKELNELFEICHGQNETIDSLNYRKSENSMIPILDNKSMFFACYYEDIYDVNINRIY